MSRKEKNNFIDNAHNLTSKNKIDLQSCIEKLTNSNIEESIDILGDLLNLMEKNRDSRLDGISILYCEYLIESFMEEETAKLSHVLGTSDIRILEETDDEDLNISWDILWNIKDKKYLSRREYLKGQILLLNNNFTESNEFFNSALEFTDTNILNLPFLHDISPVNIHKKIAENLIYDKKFTDAIEKYNFILKSFNLNQEEIEGMENDILSLRDEIGKNKQKVKSVKSTETVDLTSSVQNK